MEQVNINIDDFTLGELAEFEDKTGLSAGQLNYQKLPIKAVAGFVWLTLRRSDPDATYEDVAKRKAGEFDIVYEPMTESGVDPTEGDS